MLEPPTGLTRIPHRVGVAADHGGLELKDHLVGKLRAAGCAVVDFGNCELNPDDD